MVLKTNRQYFGLCNKFISSSPFNFRNISPRKGGPYVYFDFKFHIDDIKMPMITMFIAKSKVKAMAIYPGMDIND